MKNRLHRALPTLAGVAAACGVYFLVFEGSLGGLLESLLLASIFVLTYRSFKE